MNPPPPTRRAWPRLLPPRQFLLVCASLGLAQTCRADLFETPGWTLLGTATGKVGYDSNLTFSRDGVGDGFGTAEADLMLERLNSATFTEFSGSVAETDFLSHRAASQLDATAAVNIRYPNVDSELPRFDAMADWSRLTAADPELNRRLTIQKTEGDVGGRVVTEGQFGLDADLDANLYDYSADGLGRNQQTVLKVGLAYDPTTLTEVSANIAGGLGTSSGDQTATVRDRSETATIQVRGQILPKLTSTVFVGVTHTSYTGGTTSTSTLPTSGGELVWDLSPGKSLRGGVSLTTGFAPDGETQRKTLGTLDYRQALSEVWSFDLLAQVSRYSDRSTGFLRLDTSESGTASLQYKPSSRFDLSLGYSLLHQTSNLIQAGFARSLVTLQANFHL
jgi:hypothetical protein